MCGARTLYCGIDVGSTWAKGVAVNATGEPVARGLARTGMSFEQAARDVMALIEDAPETAGSEFAATVATGYGRKNVAFADAHRTEISCHARGAFRHHDGACHVVDIGGQDNKVIQLADDGAVVHFQMNRKCAAGTGAFIEEIARRLDVGLDKLETLAENADEEITLASFCTVFSATEVIKLIREGQSPANICRGIFNAVVARVVEMGQLGDPIILTGGVAAAFPVVGDILAARTGATVRIPDHAQYVGALGAALEARDLADAT